MQNISDLFAQQQKLREKDDYSSNNDDLLFGDGGYANPPKRLATLNKKSGVEKEKRARQLNKKTMIESKYPFLINGDGDMISTKVNKNYERKYRTDYDIPDRNAVLLNIKNNLDGELQP